MRKYKLILGITAFVILSVGVAITRTSRFQKWCNPLTLVLPQDADVVEMRASLRNFQGMYAAVPAFTVPTEHVPVILDWLRPAKYDRESWELNWMHELGEVVIRTTTGEEIRLQFYWTGKNPTVFTRDGVAQFWGRGVNTEGRLCDGGMSLYYAIRQAALSASR